LMKPSALLSIQVIEYEVTNLRWTQLPQKGLSSLG
jgi:hypothetical protein